MSADPIGDLVGRSVLVRAAGQAVDRLCAAAAASAAAAALARARRAIDALAPAARVRLAGIALLTAIVTFEVLQTRLPAHARPAAPAAFRLLVAALALTVTIGAPQIVRAWPASRLRAALLRIATHNSARAPANP